MRQARDPRPRPAFTLVELLVVIVIIGIILAFLLAAANDARRRAEEDATLALITKLETAVNDRLDALMQTRPDPTPGHFYMAGIYQTTNGQPLGWPQYPYGSAAARAQVFAWYDYIKRELPDVFFVINLNPASTDYPVNFAGNPYSWDANLTGTGQWVLPFDAGTVLSAINSTLGLLSRRGHLRRVLLMPPGEFTRILATCPRAMTALTTTATRWSTSGPRE